MDEQQVTPEQAIEDFDFESVYANNARFEASVWDLKILFGQLGQHTGKSTVNWHTAVTMPWMQVKIFEYFLRVNLAFHELENGPLKIHRNVLPPEPTPPADELQNDPVAKALYEVSVKIYADLFHKQQTIPRTAPSPTRP